MSQLRLRPTGKTGLAADLLSGPRLAGTMEHSVRWTQMGRISLEDATKYLLAAVSVHVSRYCLISIRGIRAEHVLRIASLTTTHDEYNRTYRISSLGIPRLSPPDWSRFCGGPSPYFLRLSVWGDGANHGLR